MLAEADGLADCEVFGDDVGLTDFVGLGLPAEELGDVFGCTTTTLEGDGLECRPAALEDGLVFGEFSCRAVLLPVFPLVWPAA